MTDREMMIAVFKAIDQLSIRLTGKSISVAIETEEGIITVEGSWQLHAGDQEGRRYRLEDFQESSSIG